MSTEALLILATSRQKFKKHCEMQTKSDLPLFPPATFATLLTQLKNLKMLVAL